MTDSEAISSLRLRKRYRLQLRRHGRCWACQFRQQGADGCHCKGFTARQGSFDTDGRLPVFRFDAAVLEGLRDAQ